MSLLLRALPYLAAVALGIAWTAVAYRLGGSAREDAVRLAWQTERTANARAVAHAIERTLDAERSLGNVLAEHEAKHRKEIDLVQAERDDLAERLGADAVRVSVPTRVAACAPSGAPDSTAASEPAQARAELDPAFATALARIASDGDAAVVDLNACIDRYNEVRAGNNALIGHDDAQAP